MKDLWKIQRLTSLVLLPVVLWLFFNAVSNWHYHQLPDGGSIRHSHPFAQNAADQTTCPLAAHSHSSLELSLLNLITQISLLLVLFVWASTSKAYLFEKRWTGIRITFSLQEFPGSFCLRGPPCI